jgi:uncharacterized protein YndB with AHSA1/START domain
VAPIVNSIEISRPPDEVFAYVTDPSQLPRWQESVVSVRWDAGTPVATGSRVVLTRRVGRIEREMTAEVAELTPPRSWAIRGVDGPVRGIVNGTIEPDRGRQRVACNHRTRLRGPWDRQTAHPARGSAAGADRDAQEPAKVEGTARSDACMNCQGDDFGDYRPVAERIWPAARIPLVQAAGVGFEPTEPVSRPGGFQDRPFRPLGHPARGGV